MKLFTTAVNLQTFDQSHSLVNGDVFCEMGKFGDVMECFKNYTEWIMNAASKSSRAVGAHVTTIGAHGSPRQDVHCQILLPFRHTKDSLNETFARTALEDMF